MKKLCHFGQDNEPEFINPLLCEISGKRCSMDTAKFWHNLQSQHKLLPPNLAGPRWACLDFGLYTRVQDFGLINLVTHLLLFVYLIHLELALNSRSLVVKNLIVCLIPLTGNMFFVTLNFYCLIHKPFLFTHYITNKYKYLNYYTFILK